MRRFFVGRAHEFGARAGDKARGAIQMDGFALACHMGKIPTGPVVVAREIFRIVEDRHVRDPAAARAQRMNAANKSCQWLFRYPLYRAQCPSDSEANVAQPEDLLKAEKCHSY